MEKLKWLKEHATLVVSIIVVISSFFVAIYNVSTQNDEILDTLKTTQQMALKSVIWNEHIPVGERASACDVYIASGYNSLTKKECEFILEEVAKDSSFFNGREVLK